MALKGLRPPTHRIDVPGQYVFPWDDAFDRDRILAERAELAEMTLTALKVTARAAMRAQLGRDLTDEETVLADESCVLTEDERTQAEERHPVPMFTSGETRFDPASIGQSPRGPARAFDYFREGAQPTIFHLRRVGYQARMRCEALALRDVAAGHAAWVKAGVESITRGGEVLWKATPQERELSEDWMESICESDQGALLSLVFLADACRKYSAPLTESEGKP